MADGGRIRTKESSVRRFNLREYVATGWVSQYGNRMVSLIVTLAGSAEFQNFVTVLVNYR